jgi:hypothetical protein
MSRYNGAVLAFRLDNARKPESRQVDCPVDEALIAAGYMSTPEA